MISDEFNIYTREAGAGILSVAVEGPSAAKIEMADNPNGYTMVSYTVTKEGRSTLPQYVLYCYVDFKNANFLRFFVFLTYISKRLVLRSLK